MKSEVDSLSGKVVDLSKSKLNPQVETPAPQKLVLVQESPKETSLDKKQIQTEKKETIEEERKEALIEKAKQNALKKAEQVLRSGSASTGPNKYPEIAYAYAQGGNIAEAVKVYKKAILDSPDDKDLHFNLGALYVMQKKYAAALKEFDKVVALDENDKEAYYNLSICYGKLNNREKSDLNYRKYLELENDTRQ